MTGSCASLTLLFLLNPGKGEMETTLGLQSCFSLLLCALFSSNFQVPRVRDLHKPSVGVWLRSLMSVVPRLRAGVIEQESYP